MIRHTIAAEITFPQCVGALVQMATYGNRLDFCQDDVDKIRKALQLVELMVADNEKAKAAISAAT